jgi:hypothetical protein
MIIFKSFSYATPLRTLAIVLVMQLAGIPAPGQAMPAALKIVALEGDGATGPVRSRPSHVPVVRVVDEIDRPVAGAAVMFTLPTDGATGVFPKGEKMLMVMTDDKGIASAQGLRFNQVPGKVPINVNASYKGLTARTSLTLESVAPAGYKPGRGGGHHGTLIAIAAAAAAGAVGGVYYATKGGGATPAPTPAAPQPIGLTPGTATLGPPH